MKTALNDTTKDFLQNRDICLIGFMGSGKSYIGEILHNELSAEYIDTDRLIEETENKAISEIFKEKGEKYFRALEKNVLKDLVYGQDSKDSAMKKTRVISTGGGLPIQAGNRKLMKILGSLNICLNPPFETILQRIKSTKRPLIYRRSRQYIFNLWQARYAQYQKIAHISISEVSVTDIFKALNERIEILLNKG